MKRLYQLYCTKQEFQLLSFSLQLLLSVIVFNGDVAFSINNGYLGYDGNYYEQPGRLEEQFKKFYSLAKEKETTIEY